MADSLEDNLTKAEQPQTVTDSPGSNDAEKKPEVDENKAKNMADTLIKLVKNNVSGFVIDKNTNEVYALVHHADRDEAILLVHGESNKPTKRGASWLRGLYYATKNEVCYEEPIKQVLATLEVQTLNAPADEQIRVDVNYRIAFKGGHLYYDLVDPKNRIIEISPDGTGYEMIDTRFEFMEDNAPVWPIFRRTYRMGNQVMPKQDDTGADCLEEFAALFRIKDRHLFKVHLASMFLPDAKIPIMLITGTHGSSKTATSKAVKEVVDPRGNVIGVPFKEDDLATSIYNKYLAAFDNLSNLTQEKSDMLCRAIDGSEYTKRTLYSDSNLHTMTLKIKLILNGIAPKIHSPDLMDRTISYQTDMITKDDRLAEDELEAKLASLMPGILHQIFMALSMALKIYPIRKKKLKGKLERMADFTIWGEAISIALGYKENEFLNEYRAKNKALIQELAEHYILIDTVKELMRSRGGRPYEDSMQHLYSELSTKAFELGIEDLKPTNFPRSASTLRGHLTRLKPMLHDMGYGLTFHNSTQATEKWGKNASLVKITSPETLL